MGKQPAKSSQAISKAPSGKAPKHKTAAKPMTKKAIPKVKATRATATGTRRKARVAHPKLDLLLGKLRPGRYANGTLIITQPDAHLPEMRRWLMGNVDGRVALGRTAFGDIVVFRDLRERAADQGFPGAEDACDVALIDLNYKRMTVLAHSVEEFQQQLGNAKFQKAFLRRSLYDKVKARLGDFADDEAYSFVPALALGGKEDAASVQRAKWGVYQDLLFQL
jgi:hypothetical protein